MDSGLQSIIKFITDYGVMVVICGIFLYAAIRLINLGISVLSDKLSKTRRKSHDELVDIRTDVSEKIQSLIEDYLLTTHVNRVHVIEFSNSVVSVAYLPFRYMTCTYEVHDIQKTATGHKIDRMSTSLFTPFFQKLQLSNYYIIDIDSTDNLVGGAMCDLMKSQNEHKALCAPLATSKGKFIGYVQATKDVEFTATDVDSMLALSAKVSALLSVVDK